MDSGWKKEEFECYVKDRNGFEIPAKCEFKYKADDYLEVGLVSVKDENGKNIEVSDSDRQNLENQFVWWEYRHLYGRPVHEERKKIAKELLHIAKSLIAGDGDDSLDDFDLIEEAADKIEKKYPELEKKEMDYSGGVMLIYDYKNICISVECVENEYCVTIQDKDNEYRIMSEETFDSEDAMLNGIGKYLK